MSVDACAWDHPGESRYTGTVAAAIAAYRLPPATQHQLVAAWERRDFADTVAIDRDSIRGRTADYRSGIEQMHFGSAGKVCMTVTRAGWAPKHVETAVVLCAAGECIGVPSVCGNVFRLTRVERAAPPLPPAYLDGADLRIGGPIGNAAGYAYAIPLAPVIAEGQGGYAGESWGAAAGFGYALVYLPSECACCGAPPAVPAVPEPMAAALIAAGLGFVVAVARVKA